MSRPVGDVLVAYVFVVPFTGLLLGVLVSEWRDRRRRSRWARREDVRRARTVAAQPSHVHVRPAPHHRGEGDPPAPLAAVPHQRRSA